MLSIQKKSLVDMVYDKLRESIIQLQLPLGSKLNVNELRDRMEAQILPAERELEGLLMPAEEPKLELRKVI